MAETEEELLAEWLKRHNYVPVNDKAKVTRTIKNGFTLDNEGNIVASNEDPEICLDIEINDDGVQHKYIGVGSGDYINLLKYHYYALLKNYMIMFSSLSSKIMIYKQLQW